MTSDLLILDRAVTACRPAGSANPKSRREDEEEEEGGGEERGASTAVLLAVRLAGT